MTILLFIIHAINLQTRHHLREVLRAAHTTDYSDVDHHLPQLRSLRLNFPNTEASLVMEVGNKEEQSEGNKSQAEWEETLINEVINDFLNSFDEVEVMLAQQAGIPTRACNVNKRNDEDMVTHSCY